MVIGSRLGSEEQSGLWAHIRVVMWEIVLSPRIKALMVSISLTGAALPLMICALKSL
jgi:hypothetical protein